MTNDFKTIISIIIPVQNTIEHLKKCLDSICMQSLNNMEIIIIDDASTQDICPLLKDYQNAHNIIYTRNETSLGPGGARNKGLSLASGKYVGFCDSDDWVDYDFYSYSVKCMEQYSADIGMCTQKREYDYIPDEPVYKCKYDELLSFSSDVIFRIMTYQYQMGIKVIPPCINKIYRRDFLRSLNIRFEENMYFQDVYFSCQTLLNARKIICIPHVQYHHYKRPHSIIQSFDSKHTADFIRLFTLIKSYLKEKQLYEQYCYNYYKFLEHFYNIIIREIFEFVPNDKERKMYISDSLKSVKSLIDFDEYIAFTTAEELRQHIQPNIKDTTLY